MKTNVKLQNAQLNQDRIDIISVLLMKIRGYSEIQAYNVRKEQTVRFMATLTDFFRQVRWQKLTMSRLFPSLRTTFKLFQLCEPLLHE